MPNPQPIYTPDNCNFAYQLIWGVSVFWKIDAGEGHWFDELKEQTERDGVRLLRHQFSKPGVSQFLASSRPDTIPLSIVRSIKGRLGKLVCGNRVRAFGKNYGLRSIGSAKRSVIERYIESQLERHPMADARVQERLAQVQICNRDVDLSQPQRTTHALYWYNLHVVLEHDGWNETRAERLIAMRDMIVNSSSAHGYLLSRAGILSNHIHFSLGCPVDKSPLEIALGYMNNLAYVYGMTPILMYSAYTGTFGEYDLGAIKAENIAPREQVPWGRMDE